MPQQMKNHSIRDLIIYICEEHCMIQIIEETTRKENTIDLVYTNDIGIVTNIDVNTSAISDHNKIEITTTYRIKEEN